MLAAREAGKHVLLEKPFASSADAATEVADKLRADGPVVMEGYHPRYHPLRERLRQIVASGELGEIRGARAQFTARSPPSNGFRWNVELGGGSLLDMAYYLSWTLSDLTPGEVRVGATRAWTRGEVVR